MSWARLEDSFPDHPKVMALSDAAFRLHVTAICYASRYNTDGAISPVALKAVRGTSSMAGTLVAAGVWDLCPEGGWQIHDFLDYNPSREEAAITRATRAAAGRLGGQRSGEVRRSKNEAGASPELRSKNEAPASAKTKQILEAKSNPDPSRPGSKTLKSLLTTRAPAREGGDESFEKAIAALDRIKVRLNPVVADEVGMLLDEGIKPEWFDAATIIAARNNAMSWGYVRRILQGWGAEGPPAAAPRTPAKPGDGYREPPPPHIDDVLEAIKNRPRREPSDPGEDALLKDMRVNNPAAYEAEMDLRRRAHERAAAQ